MPLINLNTEFKIKVNKSKQSDLRFILNLYNLNIKKRFFNSNDMVSFSNHKKWYNNFIKSKSSSLYVVSIKNRKIGYVRFTNLFKNIYSVSIAILNKYFSTGVSSKLINIAIKKLFQKKKNFTLIALIKKNNLRSKIFFLKNKFVIQKIKKNCYLSAFLKKDNNIFVYKDD